MPQQNSAAPAPSAATRSEKGETAAQARTPTHPDSPPKTHAPRHNDKTNALATKKTRRCSAVGLASSGAAYVGVNLEFAGAPLSQSVHGEQFLAANLLLHGERGLDTLAVSAAPCGHCRQFYSELVCAVSVPLAYLSAASERDRKRERDALRERSPRPRNAHETQNTKHKTRTDRHQDSVRFLFGAHGAAAPEEYSLRQLLPARFGPLDLLDLENSPVPLLLEQQSNRLEWAPGALKALERRAGDAAFQKAAAAALGAARGSYSPYTRCPSGVALVAAGGRVFAGGYVENAAHNPGLAPAQAAVVSAVVGAVGGYEEVEEAVVAELPKGLVQQFGVARAVLRAATGKRALPVTRLPVRWAR